MSDDRHDDDIPGPDVPESEAERARARSFARLIDGLIAGGQPPPALDADDRELLDTAALVRASVREASLADDKRKAVIDRAFADALGLAPAPVPADGGGATPLRPRRARPLYRVLPWSMAAVAAAAAIALAVTRPTARTRTVETVVEQPALADSQRSRPADPLVGRIDKAHADRTSDRIDLIVADRMAGYRSLYLSGRKGGSQ